ncbi:MAG: tRNA(Met) cytidine acetyltransferase [Colwellia sp.]|nr:tRNA(Met) cytidine acetyltransferase [Colwellia sp.]
MPVHFFTAWFDAYSDDACLLNERRLVVLSGSESWALSLVESINILPTTVGCNMALTATNPSCLIYGDSSVFPINVQKKRYRDKLGSESDVIIFADSQFTVDAFAALSGTLKAGGIFFLIAPEINENRGGSLFLNRFYSLIESMPVHVVISQKNAELPSHFSRENKQLQRNSKQLYPHDCMTSEQYDAVKTIEKVVTGHRKRPLVLTADRGRGKSSALAIACAQLMKTYKSNEFNIVITAPDKQALTVFFQQLAISLPSTEQQGSNLLFGKTTLSYIAVDQLLKQPIKTNLLLVDEAAAIPVHLLEQLLSYYHRVVFSSTVHGYEGAGRGFTLRFQQTLNKVCPQWQSLHIKQPIRWREFDPLENLVFEACLLNAELPSVKCLEQPKSAAFIQENKSKVNSPLFKVLSAKALVDNEKLLKQVFAVLVTAHYQTKPSDLQLLLDNPHVQVTCLFSSDKEGADIIAVALLMHEGANHGVGQTDVNSVKNSQRRLRNQLLPQSLLSHSGFEPAFDYRYLRVMRIAVHPQLQKQGMGSYFLSQIELLAVKQRIDFIGTSFGVSSSLLCFWLKAGFSTARIGFTKDKASGEHSALLLKGNNDETRQLQLSLSKDFYRSFDYLLLEEYKTLSSELVYLLLIQQKREDLVSLSALDVANVKAFAQGERLYSSCAYSLYLWLKHDLLINTTPSQYYSAIEQNVLIAIARLIQKYDTVSVCQQYCLTGKKMLNQTIQNYVRLRLKDCEV